MSAVDEVMAPARSRREPSTADYLRLFNLAEDLLTIAGLDGYFKKVNPAWTRVMGWSEAELLARPVADFMHSDDRERTLAARAALAQGTLVRGLENRYLCKDGSYRWLSWQSSVELADGTVFAVARDVTERRKCEAERLIISKLESTGVLAGGIAHDFNNLLGGLLLNLHMVAVAGPTNEEQQQQLRRAREAVRAAAALTQQLLTFARGGEAAREVRELPPLLQRAVGGALSGGNVRAEFDIAPGLPCVDVDEAQFEQVIRNVVLNAREAMPCGGLLWVSAENVAAADAADERVRIRIRDQGAGIAPENLGKIFDPYFSTKPRGTQKGMGLGLTICRTIVDRHGGAIQAESSPGAGTTITIELPGVRASAAAPAPHAPDAPVAAAATGHARSLLVMDDEPVFRELVGEAMRRYGYHVELAATGDEALALYELAERSGRRFDAVLFDLTVRGGRGGAETMRLLHERHPGARGILMTGYSSEQTFRDYAQHGFSAALGKPFSVDALHAALDQVLSG